MTALELIGLINQVLFVGLFVAVVVHALRAPSRTAVDTALLFGAIASVVILARVAEWQGWSGDPLVTGVTLVLLNVAPLAMLRLVDDFSDSPRWLQNAGLLAFVITSVLAVAAFGQMAALVEIATILFYAAVGGYSAVAFAREAVRTRGITRRRMTAVAIGAGLFIAAIVVLFVGALVPAVADGLGILAQLAALAAVIAFFLGFLPPEPVRRSWREPDLRGFLERSVHLTALADDRVALTELQNAVAATFGASGASIGLADRSRGILRYASRSGEWVDYPDDAFIAGRAFTLGTRQVALDAMRADPEHADAYGRAGARTVIATPITTDDRRIGVLSVYANREPIFIEDDLWLLDLLADQAAVLLEARTLATHSSELRAREDAARLKEEFLSAAAHDLRTPLTVVLGQAELLQRRAERYPDAPADAAGLARIVREAQRLRDLVGQLLDAQRLEGGRPVLELASADLGHLVESIRDRHLGHGVTVGIRRPDEPVIVSIDARRIEQVLDNLVENAVKYGAADEFPTVEIDTEVGEARIKVIDHGLGIPDEERDRIFERFYRATNAVSVTDTGLGLGLYICRRIVEEHGGRIWHEPTPGGGSTFVVTLPLPGAASEPLDASPTLVTDDWRPAAAGEAVADA